MKAKNKESAFDDVNPKWLSLLLAFLSADPPSREITVRAESGDKSVNIIYDPHNAEAVEAAEVWRKALFADVAQFKAVAPVAVKGGDGVTFAEPPRKETNGDKIRKADISVLSELLAAVKFGFWDSSYEIKSGVSVQHPEIFNRLNAYAGRIGRGDITCLDLIRAMTDNDLSEWLCLFQTREAEAWERLMGAPPDYSKPLILESKREEFLFWLKKRSETQDERRVTFDSGKPTGEGERIEKSRCEFLRKHPETVKSDEPAEPEIIANPGNYGVIGFWWEDWADGSCFLRWRTEPGADALKVACLTGNPVWGFQVTYPCDGAEDVAVPENSFPWEPRFFKEDSKAAAMRKIEDEIRERINGDDMWRLTWIRVKEPPKADLQQLDRAIRDLSDVVKDDQRGLHTYFDGVNMTYILECLKKYREMVGGVL